MKHLLLCLLALGTAAVFTACDDDDDNNGSGNTTKDGKRMVSKITTTYKAYPEDKDEMTFTYDKDGRITAIKGTGTYLSKDKEKKCTDTDDYTYTVTGKTLKVTNAYVDGETGEDSSTSEGTFTLNDDGFVISGEETDSDDDKYVYTNTYSDNYLTQIKYTINGGAEQQIVYSRTNGDITKGVHVYTYYDEENKANIDFANLDHTLGIDDFFLGLTGYLGKQNKHLVKTIKRGMDSEETFTYKFDKDGYVTEFTSISEDGEFTYQISYK